MKKCIGIYFVIGYGNDCDGYSRFNCIAFVDKQIAQDYLFNCCEGSDGVQYSLTSDMEIVQEYCDHWERNIPFAYVDVEQEIRTQCTYIN